MTERKRATSARGARAKAPSGTEFLRELDAIEAWNAERRLKERGLPEAWDALAWDLPAEPAKLSMTLPLEAGVAAWFEALGPGFETRINAVLRLYMLGVQSREIEAPEHFDWRGERI